MKQASKVKNKEAENKLKLEKMKNTPGKGFQKNQNIPFNVPFCFMCLKYVEKIHFCSELDKYLNIDERNLFFIEGDTPDQVTGVSDKTGKCSVFQTKNEMKNGMIDRRKDRAIEFHIQDDLTNSLLTISTFDVQRYGS